MTSILQLPPEVLTGMVSNLFLPDLQNLADSRLLFCRICAPRIRRHRDILEAFASFDIDDNEDEKWPKLPYWKTLLLKCLREPETIYYVKTLHGPDSIDDLQHAVPTFYVQEEPYFCDEEKMLVTQALTESPWISDDDDYSHLFEDKSTPGFNSQLVPRWKTTDILGILLPMLYNLESICIRWDIDERDFDRRRDYISLVQVLERIQEAALKDPTTYPWPKLTRVKVEYGPQILTSLIQADDSTFS